MGQSRLPAAFRESSRQEEGFETKWKGILVSAAKHRDNLQVNQKDFRTKLYADVNALKGDVTQLAIDYDSGGITNCGSPMESYEKVEKFRNRVNILNKTISATNTFFCHAYSFDE